MPRLLIVPEFAGDLNDSTRESCDFFLICEESAVPVEQFTLLSDGHEATFHVGPGKYKTALFLLYLAVLARKTSYLFERFWQPQIVLYYGTRLVEEARLKPESHPALALLLGDNVAVTLHLKPGYVLPDCKGRTIHELIAYAWERRDELASETPVPLLRYALISFHQAVQERSIPIMQFDDPNTWPSRCWVERINELCGRLAIPLPVIAAA